MKASDGRSSPYRFLTQATMVVLLFQATFLLAQVFDDAPYSSAMTAILAATLALSAINQRLSTTAQASHAVGYVIAWRYAALLFVAALSVLVAVRTYMPQATPNGVPTLIGMLFAVVIALKGALLGKLKPGCVLGLRLRWTRQSRLAWEQSHRLMGRILFFGGMTVLIAAPFVPAVGIMAAIISLIVAGVTAGTIKSWRVWRSDPERLVHQ